MTLVCASITSENEAKRAKICGAEAVEWRFDLFNAVPDAFNFDTGICNIAAFKDAFTPEYGTRALEAGADFLDIDENSRALCLFARDKVICSHHDFFTTPETDEICAIFSRLEKHGLPKAAFTVNDAKDLAHIARASEELKKSGRPFILIGMGECGKLTRICAKRLGSYLNYCYIEKPTAPGQLQIGEIHDYTHICGVCGWPLAFTLSPAIHNAAFKKAGIAGCYLRIPCKPEDANLLPELIQAYNISGLNITIPLKQAVMPYLEKITPEAKQIGAVNTVTKDLCGCNTDICGISFVLDRFSPAGKRLLIIGAGGAARAAAFYAQKAGARLFITNRTAAKAAALAKEFGGTAVLPENAGTYDIYVNAAPIAPFVEIPCGAVYFDMKYHKYGGFGRDMLIAQAAESFQIWTGTAADKNAMYKALEEKV
ncbi:MAG TPA: type I 3-dehydroquinate dehydratase [Methanocorpusculum sp.]|nr:type I 3-dehydroquinate dehydratase [Methanocorpusculum sp.]